MFARENVRLLRKHYTELTGIPLDEAFLPTVVDDGIDVGKGKKD